MSMDDYEFFRPQNEAVNLTMINLFLKEHGLDEYTQTKPLHLKAQKFTPERYPEASEMDSFPSTILDGLNPEAVVFGPDSPTIVRELQTLTDLSWCIWGMQVKPGFPIADNARRAFLEYTSIVDDFSIDNEEALFLLESAYASEALMVPFDGIRWYMDRYVKFRGLEAVRKSSVSVSDHIHLLLLVLGIRNLNPSLKWDASNRELETVIEAIVEAWESLKLDIEKL